MIHLGMLANKLAKDNDDLTKFKCCMALTYAGMTVITAVMCVRNSFILIPLEFSAIQ